jgi:ribosome-interacting GTPase 1
MMRFENVQVQLVDTPPLGDYLEPWFPDLLRRADAWALVLAPPQDPLDQLQSVTGLLAQYQLVPVHPGKPRPDGSLTPFRTMIIFNKADFLPDPEELALYLEFLEDRFPALAVSAAKSTGLAQLRAALFYLLGLVRVYTRVPGKAANFNSPFVIPRNTTVTELADRIHHDLGRTFKFARVWGKDTFQGQRVQRDYLLREGDVVEIHT